MAKSWRRYPVRLKGNVVANAAVLSKNATSVWVHHSRTWFLPPCVEMEALSSRLLWRRAQQELGRNKSFVWKLASCAFCFPHRLPRGPGGLSWAVALFFQVSWFMWLLQRNKGSEFVWSVQVKTLRWHFQNSSHWDWNLLSHTCQGRAQILAAPFHLRRQPLLHLCAVSPHQVFPTQRRGAPRD